MDALDHWRLDDGGADVQVAAADRAFQVDLEGALEQLGPTDARRSGVRANRLGRGE